MKKEKLFIISIDFDGAFDRVSRSVLIRKLSLFGAGTTFLLCLASIYLKTDNIIFQGNDQITYSLYAGIKQGLPLSPLLFLFYVNDIFDYFQSYHHSTKCIYELVHILMHADDATIIASSRCLAVKKLDSLLRYCNKNCIIPQYTKCEFIVINGKGTDFDPLPFGSEFLKNVPHTTLLGSQLSSKGTLSEDLKLHMEKRYPSCIKYYNYLRANKLAPLSVKLKVLKACVVNSLLFNCETFGDCAPINLEKTYNKLLKCTFNVRSNTPTLILYIESGFVPIKTLILARQLKFFNRFKEGLLTNSPRSLLFDRLMSEPSAFLRHYIAISGKYSSVEDIYKESNDQIKQKIHMFAGKPDKYKYNIYVDINPELKVSPFINIYHPLCKDIIRFRLGSHSLPIETGRWSGKKRPERLCEECGVLGDERHIIYNCTRIDRNDIILPQMLSEIWSTKGLFVLFSKLKNLQILD